MSSVLIIFLEWLLCPCFLFLSWFLGEEDHCDLFGAGKPTCGESVPVFRWDPSQNVDGIHLLYGVHSFFLSFQ